MVRKKTLKVQIAHVLAYNTFSPQTRLEIVPRSPLSTWLAWKKKRWFWFWSIPFLGNPEKRDAWKATCFASSKSLSNQCQDFNRGSRQKQALTEKKTKKKRETPQCKIPKKEHVTMLTMDPEMKTKWIIMESNQMKSSQNDTFKRHQVWFFFFMFSVKHKQVLYEERQTVACQGRVYLFCSSTERGEKKERQKEEWLKENVTNRTEIINSSAWRKLPHMHVHMLEGCGQSAT